MKLNKKIVFITGGAGFIGANITKYLLENNYKVVLLIRKKSNTSRLKYLIGKTTVYNGDLSDQLYLKKILKKISPSYILHFASYGNYPRQENVKTMIDTNIDGLNNLLSASLSIDYDAFIVAGTSSEYGFKNKPMSEEDFIKPESFYAVTKASATFLAQFFAKKFNKPIYILRLFSVYGPHEERSRLIPTVINNCLQSKPVHLTSGTVRHDFIYIKDLFFAIEKIFKKNKLNDGEIFNIGTGKQYSNEDIVKTIEKLLNKKIMIIKDFPKRKWDIGYWVANTKKAYKLLHFKAKFSLEQGLKETIEWNRNII